MDASHYQLARRHSLPRGQTNCFLQSKLNNAQTHYTTTERELLSIVETLKEHRTILLEHKIEVFTDHKNLVHKYFNIEHDMHWHLIIKEFGPKLTYIKGEHNIVADTLSWMDLKEEEFSPDAFAFEEDDFSKEHPLSSKEIKHHQQHDDDIQWLLSTNKKCKKSTYLHSDHSCELITRDDKIIIPQALQ